VKIKPNLIYIFADDMGVGDVSCFSECAQWTTAGIDRLAAEGMACTDVHSRPAVCTPSRYSVLTRRSSRRFSSTISPWTSANGTTSRPSIPRSVEELKNLLTKYVREGRSTPGEPQQNTGSPYWAQLTWLREEDVV